MINIIPYDTRSSIQNKRSYLLSTCRTNVRYYRIAFHHRSKHASLLERWKPSDFLRVLQQGEIYRRVNGADRARARDIR